MARRFFDVDSTRLQVRALRPDGEQRRKMIRFAGACRFVFNHALALQRERHARGEKNSATPNSAKCSLSGNPIHRPLGCPRPTPTSPTGPQRPRTRIFELLCQTSCFSALQEEGARSQFPLSQGYKLDQLTAESFSRRLAGCAIATAVT